MEIRTEREKSVEDDWKKDQYVSDISYLKGKLKWKGFTYKVHLSAVGWTFNHITFLRINCHNSDTGSKIEEENYKVYQTKLKALLTPGFLHWRKRRKIYSKTQEIFFEKPKDKVRIKGETKKSNKIKPIDNGMMNTLKTNPCQKSKLESGKKHEMWDSSITEH